MSTAVAAAAAPATPPSAPPHPARRRRRAGAVVLVALVLALAVVLGALSPWTTRDPLSPSSVAPEGSRALARVLDAQGVRVLERHSFDAARRDAAAGATVLVTDPDQLTPERLRALASSGADLVLVTPSQQTLDALDAGVRTAGTRGARTAGPGCAAPEAVAAGAARAGGDRYDLDGDAADGDAAGGERCYDGAWVATELGGGARLVLLGQPDVLTNRHVADDGTGALALRTLGARPDLVWYLPDPADAAPGGTPLRELVPAGALPSAVLLLLAGLLAAAWRGRRLGRLAPEALPVVVRAAETVEGHGRLYAGAGARARAAEVLRAAAVRRTAVVVRLDPRAPAGDVVDAVAQLTGRPPDVLRALLTGPPPADDAQLVRLAAGLDDLERDVHHRT